MAGLVQKLSPFGRSNGSASSAAGSGSPPAFLTVPIQHDSAWRAVSRELADREGRRQELGAPSCTVDSRGRPKIVLAEGGEQGPFAVGVGLSQLNQAKNRYCNIIAYDRTRILPRHSSEYLNASLVREPALGLDLNLLPRRWWVAAQAPTPACIHAFLSSLLTPPTSPVHRESGEGALPLVAVLLQLTPLVEKGHKKAHPYFPRENGQTKTYQPPEESKAKPVWVRLENKEENGSFRRSELSVGEEGDEQGRRVTHVEYRGWSDHGVPADPVEMLTFLRTVNSINDRLSAASGPSSQPAPILVHCSAGVGRTGTYITIASLLPLLSLYKASTPPTLSAVPPPSASHPLGAFPHSQLEKKGVERDFVGLTIDGLREQRTTMVQTQTQLRWCFEALAVAWEQDLLG